MSFMHLGRSLHALKIARCSDAAMDDLECQMPCCLTWSSAARLSGKSLPDPGTSTCGPPHLDRSHRALLLSGPCPSLSSSSAARGTWGWTPAGPQAVPAIL